MTDARAHLEDKDTESTRLLLERILRVIVCVPDAVGVKASLVGEATVFTIRVASGDVGNLIGNDRRTIQALRMILGAVGLRHQRRFSLEIEEQRT